MQLSPRPTRIPLTCSCGARLSVIPRLQGTEVKCPRCRESLLVPGEAGIQVRDDVPAVQMTLEVPVFGGLSSGVLENSVSNAELTEAASESVQEPIHGIGESSFRQVPITSRDRDMFGYLLTDAAASVNCMLEERTPKSIRTLKMESQYSATQRHIEQFLNEGKVRAVRMDTSEVGYIINPDWLKSISSSVSRSNPTENEPTRSQSPGTFDPPVRGDVKVDSEKLSGTSNKKFQPIGFTAPTRLKKRQQTANLFSPNGIGPEPETEAESNRNELNSTSVPNYDLTDSQNKIFEAVESSYASAGISPTIPELQTATSLNRFDTIKEVDALVRKGLFEFDRSSARGIRIIPEAERVLFTDRSDSNIESDAVIESAQPRSVSPADEIVAATEPALSSAKTMEPDAVAVKLSSLGSPVTPVDSTPVLPGWITELLKSELLDRQFQMAGRRVPPRETLKDFLLLLASQGFVIHRESLCHALELPVIRYAGFLSVVMRLLNIDNVPILTRDDDGEMVRLNVDLLCRQFCIVKL